MSVYRVTEIIGTSKTSWEDAAKQALAAAAGSLRDLRVAEVVELDIALGTTNTVVGAVRGGVAGTIPDAEGSRLIPSVVSFHPSGSVVVGRDALDRRLIDAPSTIYSVKRLIGRAWGSPLVEQARGKLPFELREGPAGGTVVVARGETYSLPEISAFVLRQAKAVAEASAAPATTTSRRE